MFSYLSLIVTLAYFCDVCHGDCTNQLSNLCALGYKYDANIDAWLKLNHNIADWDSARASCHAEGASLGYGLLDDVALAARRLQNMNTIWMLYTGLRQTQITRISNENVIIDTSDAFTNPNYWVRKESCEVSYITGSKEFVDCKVRLPYICYVAGTAAQTLAAVATTAPEPICGKASLGYEYSQTSGGCYKFHIEVASWSNANRTCVEEGAQLAVPNSETEVTVLTTIHNRYSDSQIHGSNWPDWSNVGIYWESGNWKTVDGTTLRQAGYEVWRQGWPSNMEMYPYACMHRTGDYTNTNNLEKYPFICEKPPRL